MHQSSTGPGCRFPGKLQIERRSSAGRDGESEIPFLLPEKCLRVLFLAIARLAGTDLGDGKRKGRSGDIPVVAGGIRFETELPGIRSADSHADAQIMHAVRRHDIEKEGRSAGLKRDLFKFQFGNPVQFRHHRLHVRGNRFRCGKTILIPRPAFHSLERQGKRQA